MSGVTVAGPVAPGGGTGASGGSLVPVFVGLKLALMRNGLRQSAKRRVAYVLSVVFTLLFAAALTLSLVLLRGNGDAATVVVLLAGMLALGWAVMPLFFPSGDETLDPSRLVMLPLRPGPLTRALLVSSLVGTGPLFTLSLAVGSAVALARGAGGAVFAVAAVPVLLLGCVVLARAVATANVRLLSSRKGRDLAILSGLFVAVGAQGVNFASQRLAQQGGLDVLEPVVAVVRWLPPASAMGSVDAASEGSYGVAAAQLLLAVAGVAGLAWSWQRSLTRLMVSPDGSTLAAAGPERDRRVSGLSRLLPGGRTGAVMLRTLRYVWRDPKTKSAWVTSLAVGLIVPVFNALQGTGSVYLACMGAGMLGVQMYNQFGQDTSAFWMVAQTIAGPADAYAELRARAYALALVTVPYTLLVVVVTAAMVGDWEKLPEVLGLSLALLGGMLCAGAVGSARMPYSIPSEGAFKNVAPGQAGLAWLSILVGLLVAGLVCAPVIVLTVVLHVNGSGLLWLVLPVGAVWGLLAAWAGLRSSAPVVARRLPEILAAVSKG
ncbi:transporter [Streptomyces sp. NPDC097619]|uniref:transporter n=1 Tax=Streptomyces sp. NPDC097619 TaxID=3157228 RepID=UPI00332F0631